MTYQVLDNGVVRDATPEEAAEIEARAATAALPEVPQSVTRRQAIQALIHDNTLSRVQPVIDALDDGTPQGALNKATAQNEYDNSLDFQRTRPLLIQLATAIGYDTSDKIDQLFIQAAAL